MSDRIHFSPKIRFLAKQTDDSKAKYHEIMSSSMIQDSAKDVLAEMAWYGYSNEKIAGARTFLELLLNFSEVDHRNEPLPIKALKSP